MKVQVEEVSHDNEVVRLQRGIGIRIETEEATIAERGQNQQMRESLRESESKKQEFKDKERDHNRDIYQMA